MIGVDGGIPGWWTLGSGVTLVLAGIGLLLILGTIVRGIGAARRPNDPELGGRLRSLGSWWVLFVLFVGALALGAGEVVAVMAGISLLLLWEALQLSRRTTWYPLVAIAAVVLFVLVWRGGSGLLMQWFPAGAMVLLVGEWAWRRRAYQVRPGEGPKSLVPAVLVGIVGPLYASGVAVLPAAGTGSEFGLGWFVLLVVLTELNDSAQAWWGRGLGSRHLAPDLSPAKTWEGLVGGVVTTSVAALVLSPVLTPYGRQIPLGGGAWGPPWVWCIGLGVAVGLGGTAGDLLGSRLKRRAGIKDSGRLIPGQGGVLDRADSLTVTAPLFYFVTRLLWLG